MRRGIRIPAWYLLLVPILSILSRMDRQSCRCAVLFTHGVLSRKEEAWQAWEASGQEFWQQRDGVVAILDGLMGETSFTDVVKEKQR